MNNEMTVDIYNIRERYYPCECPECGYVASSEHFESDCSLDDCEVWCPKCLSKDPDEIETNDYISKAITQATAAKDAEIERLKDFCRELQWMAKRYAEGRQTYAPSTVNRITRQLLARDVELILGAEKTPWARDGGGMTFSDLSTAEWNLGEPMGKWSQIAYDDDFKAMQTENQQLKAKLAMLDEGIKKNLHLFKYYAWGDCFLETYYNPTAEDVERWKEEQADKWLPISGLKAKDGELFYLYTNWKFCGVGRFDFLSLKWVSAYDGKEIGMPIFYQPLPQPPKQEGGV